MYSSIFRTRLFEDSPVSDVTSGSPWDEIAAMLTPCQTVNESLDSGIGSSAELSVGRHYNMC